MEIGLSELISIAKSAANAGAEVHRQAIERGNFSISGKASPSDLVTEIDRQTEQEIVSIIQSSRPNDAILGEEGMSISGTSDVRWILDPLSVPRVRDIRRSGCPSLDICGVAAGRLDAFYECGLGAWDIAAASAIAEAVGATILLFNSALLPPPVFVVANAKLLAALVELLTEAGAVELESSEA